MSSRSQLRGSDLEHAFQRVLACFFREAGYEVEHDRMQAAGIQFGCDLRWVVKPPGQTEAVRLLFECKNYASRVPLKDIIDKPLQAEIGGDRIDFWILVSPHSGLANDAEVLWGTLARRFGFPLLRLTPEEGVNSFIALEPNAYRTVYGCDPEPFDRPAVLERWTRWFENHLSSATYLQRFSKLLEIVDSWNLREFVAKGPRQRDLALGFYRGIPPSWEDIVTKVDVRRRDSADRVALAFDGDIRGVHLILVLSEGGSGKSTFLRRVAFEASERGGLVIFSPRLAHAVDARQLQEEIIQIVRRRRGRKVMIVIDNGAVVLEQLTLLGQRLRDEAASVVLVVAERRARWRDAQDDLKARFVSEIPSTSEEHLVLPALDENELQSLVERLKHFRVSNRVHALPKEKLQEEFRRRFRGDLLVTLHELIDGQKFDNIVRGEEEEFRKQHPSFPFVYALTAAFHQFGVPVPETLLARTAGVLQGDLSKELKFQDMLERSEQARLLAKTKWGWVTRHEVVAKSVFNGLGKDFAKAALLGVVTSLNPEASDEVNAVMSVLASPQTRREFRRSLEYARDIYDAALNVISSAPFCQAYALLEKEQGDYEKARALFERSIRADPTHAPSYQTYALMEKEQGDYKKARALFERAIKADPTHAPSYQAYALMEKEQGDYKKARALFERAIKADPTHTPSYQAYALMEKEQGDYKNARSLFRRAIEADPTHAYLYLGWADMEGGRRHWRLAEAILMQGHQRGAGPSPPMLQYRGLMLSKLERFDEALRCFEEGLDIDPSHAPIFQELAKLFAKLGDLEKVEAILRNGCAKCPNDRSLSGTLAKLLLTTGRADEGNSWATQSLSNCQSAVELEQTRAFIFGGPLRLGSPKSYHFIKRDVEGIVFRLFTSPDRPFGFIEATDGARYYFSLNANQAADFCEGSHVRFDVIEYSDREDNRLKAKFVEIMPEFIDAAGVAAPP